MGDALAKRAISKTTDHGAAFSARSMVERERGAASYIIIAARCRRASSTGTHRAACVMESG